MVNKKYDAEPRLDEADSVPVDDKSTSKKIGTQENSSVQEITKPVVKTKETSDDLFNMTKHPNFVERRCGRRNSH
jgi:hypothetical protein